MPCLAPEDATAYGRSSDASGLSDAAGSGLAALGSPATARRCRRIAVRKRPGAYLLELVRYQARLLARDDLMGCKRADPGTHSGQPDDQAAELEKLCRI